MRRAAPLTAAVAGLTLLAACSTGEPVDMGEGTGSGTEGTGQTLHVAIGGEPDQLDPNKTSSYFSFEVLENVYDTLVQTDENLEMQPGLAESWEISDDNLTWTFHLRDDVTFHDGSDFTSEDVAYSYHRIIDEELANAWKFTAIEDIATPDDYTVVITLSQPTPNLLSNLGGLKRMATVNQQHVQSGDITTAPPGTGPFSLEEWKIGRAHV